MLTLVLPFKHNEGYKGWTVAGTVIPTACRDRTTPLSPLEGVLLLQIRQGRLHIGLEFFCLSHQCCVG